MEYWGIGYLMMVIAYCAGLVIDSSFRGSATQIVRGIIIVLVLVVHFWDKGN